MKNNCILLMSFCLILGSCTKQQDYIPELKSFDSEVFVAGELREEGQEMFSSFRIEPGKSDDDQGFLFWQGDVSEGELGPSLILGAYSTEPLSSRPLFGLQFWSDILPTDRMWTAEELDTFFTPGRTFLFGEGPGKVDVLLKMPIGGPYDFESSRSSYLADPEGSLLISGIQDYDYPVYSGNQGRSYGKLIHCLFVGQIGRYDSLADQADGNPGYFQTDEAVEIENGHATFYVEYKRE